MPQKRKGIRLWLRKERGREAVWVIRDGRRQIRTGCGEGESEGAEEALAKYVLARRKPNTGERDLSKISIADVLLNYQNSIPENKPTRNLIGYHVDNLLDFYGEKSLADIRLSVCEQYTLSRVKAGRKEATARRELKTLAAAITRWHKESPLPLMPKVTMPPDGARRERVLSRKEVAQLLWACRRRKAKHVARFILIGVYTGTRHQAILGLRWSAALVGGHIDIERGIIYRRGSAEKETSKRRPPVRIPERLGTFLARWRSADGDKAVIIRHDGASIGKMRRAWAGVVKEAGLGPEVTPHVLRHTCVSWLLWKGWTAWEVGKHVGATEAEIDKTYGHYMPTEDGRARA